jgi:hypothetical protein
MVFKRIKSCQRVSFRKVKGEMKRTIYVSA